MTVHVAVGVILNSKGEICIAKRPDGKHLAGYWEFPGGKVEPTENVIAALSRELKEELDIEVLKTEPLIDIKYEYPKKTVLLDVHLVTSFNGEAKGQEDQEVLWVAPACLKDYQFPEANEVIIRELLAKLS